MLPTQFLKKYFPNTPDWLFGGLLLVFILWLVALPIEIIEIAISQGYISGNFLPWIIRFPYIWGYSISLFLIGPLADYSSAPDKPIEILIVFLGLFISSPIYFAIGALLAIKKDATITLGVLLAAIQVTLSCFVTIWLIKFLFAG